MINPGNSEEISEDSLAGKLINAITQYKSINVSIQVYSDVYEDVKNIKKRFCSDTLPSQSVMSIVGSNLDELYKKITDLKNQSAKVEDLFALSDKCFPYSHKFNHPTVKNFRKNYEKTQKLEYQLKTLDTIIKDFKNLKNLTE
jgi:hypothetical protein